MNIVVSVPAHCYQRLLPAHTESNNDCNYQCMMYLDVGGTGVLWGAIVSMLQSWILML